VTAVSDQGARQLERWPVGAREAAVRRLQLAAVRVAPAMHAAVRQAARAGHSGPTCSPVCRV